MFPPGFENVDERCVCDKRLQKFSNVMCDINSQTIQHRGDIWVDYYSDSGNNSGLIIHSFSWPFDYCIKGKEVVFTLNNTDRQCQHNRNGLLCGRCREGFTVVLGGSSRCQKCSNSYLALLIPFSLAGIALLLLFFLLKLTVNYSTLNDLIFYGNIVHINLMSDQSNDQNNILTVFIAWLNLDVDINICFINLLDNYWKTWLQFVFPLYI